MPRRKAPRISEAVLDQLLAGADLKTAFDPNGLIDDLALRFVQTRLHALVCGVPPQDVPASHVMLDAITLYNLGYSLEQNADKIKSRFGRRAGRSTIAAWLTEHRSLTTYARLRAHSRRLFPPTQVIRYE